MRFDEVLDLVLGSRAEHRVSVAGDHNLDPEARWLPEEVVARRAEPPSMSMAEEVRRYAKEHILDLDDGPQRRAAWGHRREARQAMSNPIALLLIDAIDKLAALAARRGDPLAGDALDARAGPGAP
jgi:hypothetical protein